MQSYINDGGLAEKAVLLRSSHFSNVPNVLLSVSTIRLCAHRSVFVHVKRLLFVCCRSPPFLLVCVRVRLFYCDGWMRAHDKCPLWSPKAHDKQEGGRGLGMKRLFPITVNEKH